MTTIPKATLIKTADNKLFVLGGLWHTPERGRSKHKEARMMLRASGGSHALLLQRQIGLLDASAYPAAALKHARSAAAAIAAKLSSRTFVAAYHSAHGIYVVVRHNQLQPTGDSLFAIDDEDAAKQHFLQYASHPNWIASPRIAPASWGVAGTDERDLASDLETAPDTPLITSAAQHRARPYIQVGLIVAGVAAIGLAVGGYLLAGRKPPQRAGYEPLPAQLSEFRAALDGCLRSADALYRRTWVPGWPMTSWTCTPVDISATYEREKDAPLAWYQNLPKPSLSNDLQKATVSEVREMTAKAPITGASLPSQQEVRQRLQIVSTDVGASFEGGTQPPTISRGQQRDLPPPSWLRLTWTLTTAAPPAAWLSPLASIPATEFVSLSTTPQTTKLTAVTYVLP